MMTLYRVEHPETKNGPYNIDYISSKGGEEEIEIIEIMCNDHQDRATHPSIHNDITSFYGLSDLYCAFDNFDKLISWFEYYIDYLINMGYQILKLEIPEECIVNSKSGKQVFFKKENIIAVEVLF